MRPAWALFDLNGTLLDPAGIGEGALDEAILAMMALNGVGEYRPLPEILRAVLERRLTAGRGMMPGALEAAMAAAAAMPAYPGADEALRALADGGVRLAVLTNSPTETAERGLEAAGIRDRFAHVVGTDQVGVFKPDGRVYRHGLAAVGAQPGEAVMVAAHWWDLLGARAAGMRVAWVGHGELVLTSLLPIPEARGFDLPSTAQAILAL
jgi:2-haloacid dehalogenase